MPLLTIGDLRKRLAQIPASDDNMPVVISSDPEGNDFHPAESEEALFTITWGELSDDDRRHDPDATVALIMAGYGPIKQWEGK